MSRRKGDAWKHRPHHRAFYALPAAARQRAVDGFRANESTTEIVDALLKEHDALIVVSSLNRYREFWETTERPVLEAAEKASELVRAFKDHPTPEIQHVIEQLLMAQRLTAMTEDKKPDPNELGWLDIEQRKLGHKERALALRERQVAVQERAVEARIARERRTDATKVERELKKAKLDDDTIERIRTDVYGLAPRKSAA